INQIQVVDRDTDEIVDQMSVSFSNGTYSIDGEAVCKVDEQNQLLEWYDDKVVFSYGSSAGVHEHLRLSPARYLVELTDEYFTLDPGSSNPALTGWTHRNSVATASTAPTELGLSTSDSS